LFGVASLLMSAPLLIYQIDLAVKGTPVVLSGNCMLVELSPRVGFLDAPIDAWWKAVVQWVGL
jgi:hypothetical protein